MARIATRVAFCFWLMAALACGALARQANRVAAVGGDGVLRWQDDRSEVALLGVNHYVPFSIDYQSLKARHLDHEQAIRDDVTHFARLGLGAIRLHCFDREISDARGNLKDNDHLRLLDLLIAECKRRGIYCVMTPIAWWPAPDGGSGFSDLYTMPRMITDPAARAAQCNYLAQYFNHVNRYTGLAYKDDPAIVAVELINEPQYAPGATNAQVTEYINALVAAVRSTGCRKPIFFNCWGGRAGAVAASTADGATFGWYPTGLLSGGMLRANYLPSVDDYPSMRDAALARKAKIVYEFDAADVPLSVMYPAMARSFRGGGAQVATQFQYDPLCIAADNPDWQTHYLNLVYTPNKAISLAIAAEVFRRIPRLQRFGSYPASVRFGDFRISYARDLSELASADAFLYSNDTETRPPAPERLRRIAGCGSSPLVKWEGTGAYFLDRVSPGVWRLQVYPDAVMVADPYTGLGGEKVRVLWGRWRMEVRLPDLGDRFRFVPCDESRHPLAGIPARDGSATIGPGEYLLVREGESPPASAPGLAFVAPPESAGPLAAFVDFPRDSPEGKPLEVRANVAAGSVTCALHFRAAGARGFLSIPMRRAKAYHYQATVPAALMRTGTAEFYLSASDGTRTVCLPSGKASNNGELPASPPPLSLLQLQHDTPLPEVHYSGLEGKAAQAKIVAADGGFALQLRANGFGPPPSAAQMKWPAVAVSDAAGYATLAVKARGGPDTSAVEIALVQRDGKAFGTTVPLATGWREFAVPLDELWPMWSTGGGRLDPQQLDHIAITFGAWLFDTRREREHVVEIAAIELRPPRDTWEIAVAPRGAPVVLAEPAQRRIEIQGHPAATRLVAGMNPDKLALRVEVDGFDPAPDATSFGFRVPEVIAAHREQAAQARYLVIKARAGEPDTTRVEVVLEESDGAPWGTEISLTPEWREIRIPLRDLRYFAHWQTGAAGRGGPGDHLRPERVDLVNLCFGAWLYGDRRARPHAIEIQEIGLAR